MMVWWLGLLLSLFIAADAQGSGMDALPNPFVPRPTPDLCPKFNACLPIIQQVDSTALDLSSRTPVVFADTAGRTLNASRWDLWEWATGRWPVLQDVLEFSESQASVDAMGNSRAANAPGLFVIHDTSDSSLPFAKYAIREEMLLGDFLADAQNTSLCRFYSTNYRVLEGIAELDDVHWRDYLIDDQQAADSDQQTAPVFNMLYGGCALQARYSEYHTLRVQLQGDALYYVFTPEEVVSALAVFPSLHSAAHQSQRDLHSMDDELDLKRVSPQVVDLRAGQVLFIPAGWMVHCEAQTLSVSLDILSASTEQTKLLEALSLALPFAPDLTLAGRIINTQVFLVHVLSRIEGIKTIRQYAQRLYRARYSVLYPADSLLIAGTSFHCYRDEEVYSKEVLRFASLPL